VGRAKSCKTRTEKCGKRKKEGFWRFEAILKMWMGNSTFNQRFVRISIARPVFASEKSPEDQDACDKTVVLELMLHTFK
jgi:hypothetical protein